MADKRNKLLGLHSQVLPEAKDVRHAAGWIYELVCGKYSLTYYTTDII